MIRITSKYKMSFNVSFFKVCDYKCETIRLFRCRTDKITLETTIETVFSLN